MTEFFGRLVIGVWSLFVIWNLCIGILFMVVGICRLDIKIAVGRSLKEKRRVLRRLKDKTFSRFSLSISEVGYCDLWQRSLLGFAVVGVEEKVVRSLMDKAVRFIESGEGVELLNVDSEVIYFEGE